MSSVIILNQHTKDFPLILGINQASAEPLADIAVLSHDPFFIGTKDKGNICLGINKQSIFAYILPQTVDGKLNDPSEIIPEILKHTNISDVLSFLETVSATKFNPFNIVFGNQNQVFVAHSYILHSMVIKEISKGASIITSLMNFSPKDKRKQFIHAKLDPYVNKSWIETYKYLKTILRNQEYDILVKNSTKQSMVLAFNGEGLSRVKVYDRTKEKKYKEWISVFKSFKHDEALLDTIHKEDGVEETEVEPTPVLVKDMFSPTNYSYTNTNVSTNTSTLAYPGFFIDPYFKSPF